MIQVKSYSERGGRLIDDIEAEYQKAVLPYLSNTSDFKSMKEEEDMDDIVVTIMDEDATIESVEKALKGFFNDIMQNGRWETLDEWGHEVYNDLYPFEREVDTEGVTYYLHADTGFKDYVYGVTITDEI